MALTMSTAVPAKVAGLAVAISLLVLLVGATIKQQGRPTASDGPEPGAP